MSINVSESWDWIEPLNAKMFDYGLIRELHGPWIEAKDLALFTEICKLWPDTPEDFPRGKWASIQNLQSLVEDDVVCLMKSVNAPCTV